MPHKQDMLFGIAGEDAAEEAPHEQGTLPNTVGKALVEEGEVVP